METITIIAVIIIILNTYFILPFIMFLKLKEKEIDLKDAQAAYEVLLNKYRALTDYNEEDKQKLKELC